MHTSKKVEQSKRIYLDLLKFVRERGLEGFSWEEIPELMADLGYFNADELQAMQEASFEARQCKSKSAKEKVLFTETLWQSSTEISPHHETKRVLSIDGFFKLLEHEELELARKNAQSAKRYSSWAIGIAVASLLVSGAQAIYQLNKPVVLSETQYQGIIDTQPVSDISTQISILNKKLDELINVSKDGTQNK